MPATTRSHLKLEAEAPDYAPASDSDSSSPGSADDDNNFSPFEDDISDVSDEISSGSDTASDFEEELNTSDDDDSAGTDDWITDEEDEEEEEEEDEVEMMECCLQDCHAGADGEAAQVPMNETAPFQWTLHPDDRTVHELWCLAHVHLALDCAESSEQRKAIREYVIQESPCEDGCVMCEEESLAATSIQRVFRGFRARNLPNVTCGVCAVTPQQFGSPYEAGDEFDNNCEDCGKYLCDNHFVLLSWGTVDCTYCVDCVDDHR